MPKSTTVQRVPVWSGLLRLSHWLMAFSTLLLLATGWLLESVVEFQDASRDFHYLAAYALIGGLLLRLHLLFFDRGPGSWTALIPRREQVGAMLDMLRFYLSFGRWQLPGWYAHNPLWQPVYLVLLLLLALQALSGVVTDAPYLIAGRSLADWHGAGAVVIGYLVALHVLAVFLHDLKGTGSDVSAMVNGHRIFVIKPVQQQIELGATGISLEEIGKTSKRREKV